MMVSAREQWRAYRSASYQNLAERHAMNRDDRTRRNGTGSYWRRGGVEIGTAAPPRPSSKFPAGHVAILGKIRSNQARNRPSHEHELQPVSDDVT